ncbi:MAG: recombinase family protein [Butyricicoccus pullicaecorum]|uniref:recombinase family protein n=1 Tax=Eisenbergiella massiliensis TaxID=1720294 RepID=UPI0023F31262|nr:recombinase family protein [Eisenbergiella massiliensis]MCI6705659.1 recombinase family protein [Eisenbergiella massiliensis]MDY2968553.1 recombinase family protein [Butyricicoccus pullicaecorum]
MKIGYVRVSTVEQNEARQVEALNKLGVQKIYIEKKSGKNLDRPVLQEMLDFIREGDTVYVHDLSRISRSLTDLLNLVELLQKKKVHFISNKEQVDTTTPTGRLFLSIVGAINEFERTNLLERQREGIAIAKRVGKYKGRKPRTLDHVAELYNMWIRRDKSKAEIARDYQISRPTLDRLFKEYEKSQALGAKKEGGSE